MHPHPRPRSLAHASWILCLAAATSGCVHRGDDAYGSTVVYETEFNGSSASADFVGFVAPGDDWIIEGDVGFGGDVYDGFAFVADQPGEIEFVLSIHDPFAALALHVWDPYVGDFVFRFDSGQNPEIGAFDVYTYDTEFHLVVAPLAGAADYTLSVSGQALLPGPAASSSGRFGSDAPAPTAAEKRELAPYSGREPQAAAREERRRSWPVGQLWIVADDGSIESRTVSAVVD